MKIIKPSVEFFGAVLTDYANALRFIETAGRTCYKSEDKIGCAVSNEDFTPDLCAEYGNWDGVKGGPVNCNAGCAYHSAPKFVKKLINAGHLAMVEHSNFVVRTNFYANRESMPPHISDYALGKYLQQTVIGECVYIGGSLAAWANHINTKDNFVDNVYLPFLFDYGALFDLQHGCMAEPVWSVCPHNEIPPALHRYSATFICDRGVSHELVRHRPCSFAQESTRYVNYGGKDMEFIEPWWMDEKFEENGDDPGRDIFRESCRVAEINYNQMMDIAVYNSPQSCRAILPNALKTEIVVTADASEWAHIKKLRTHPSAHPDMVRLMNMMPWEEMGL